MDELPSETFIHVVVFAILASLVAFFIVGLPIWNFLQKDSDFAKAFGFGLAMFALGTVSMRFFWTRTVDVDSRNVQRASRTDLEAPFLDWYESVWKSVASGAAPPFLWLRNDPRPVARVVRYDGADSVAAGTGLLTLQAQFEPAARVVITHEFGHLANRDIPILRFIYSTVATLAILTGASLVTFCALESRQLFRNDLNVLVIALFCAASALGPILLARYAAVVASLREVYADVYAVNRLPSDLSFETAVRMSGPAFSANTRTMLRSLFSITMNHLSPYERLRFLADPRGLIAPKVLYFFLAAGVLLVLQANPISSIRENNDAHLPFELSWPFLAAAFTANLLRTSEGWYRVGTTLILARTVPFAAGIAIAAVLPLVDLYNATEIVFGYARGEAGDAALALESTVQPWRVQQSWLLLAVVLALAVAACAYAAAIARKPPVPRRGSRPQELAIVAMSCAFAIAGVLLVNYIPDPFGPSAALGPLHQAALAHRAYVAAAVLAVPTVLLCASARPSPRSRT